MKATVNRKQLLELLGKVKLGLPKGYCSIPVCGAVLLEAGDRRLTATATDLEVWVSGRVDAKITRAGGFCAPPKSLESFLKAVGDEWVTLVVTKTGKLRIEAESTSIELDGFKAEDFPPTPKVKGEAIEVNGLSTALSQIDYAVAKETSRPVLNGVCFTPSNNGHIELAAADGFRLAVTGAMVKGAPLTKAIIPARAIKLIERIMPHMLVNIRQNGKAIVFEGDGLTLITKPIEGSYPNSQQLIPKGGTALHFDVAEMRKALKVVAAIKTENGIVRLQTKGNALILSANNGDDSKSEVKIAAKGKARIAFNLRYLDELIARLDGEVTMRTKKPSDPAVVKHKGTIHVMMPMFVNW